MTTPAQQLQEETVKDLAERIDMDEYTIKQALRKAYILGRKLEANLLREEFGHFEDCPYE